MLRDMLLQSTTPMEDATATARRAPIELKVEYKRLNSFFADYARNISRGGTFIKTGRPLAVGTEFMFRLLVPRLSAPLLIHGRVDQVASADDAGREGAGMAIRFVYQLGDSRAHIARTVEQLMVECLGQRLTVRLMDLAEREASAT